MPDYTPQEIRLLNALADGKPHSIDELMLVLWDEQSSKGALFKLISMVRKKLQPHGQYIRCLDSTPFHPVSYVHVTSTTCISGRGK